MTGAKKKKQKSLSTIATLSTRIVSNANKVTCRLLCDTLIDAVC